eukprot:CAMPEP_0171985726 /NCGR_PEP_ID=MMETSP0993-20121228/274506_1 /TAXON_ID=483369 /ORGANISM="non described non described, Strain CCMP2098" /LENGTH=374 /DNA_ID=CAMNT_0012638613 /DNA_START=20 /DNA_END=1145 /DNA_ORIENTATION=+
MAHIGSSSLFVKHLGGGAVLPVRGSIHSAGFDVASAYGCVVPAHGKAMVKTDIAVATPLDCYARIAPRSGLAYKNHLDVGAGVVDADYRGNVGVILFNHADKDFSVSPGDRVAQLILQKIDVGATVCEVEELPDTARGGGGFGSTGVSGNVAAAAETTSTIVCGGDDSSPAASLVSPASGKLFVKRLGESAVLPVKGSDLAAGFDLASAYDVVVPAHGKAIVKTDIAVATPLDCYARIAPRSGLAAKKHIDVGAGVVDADYRGNVGVILFNFSDEAKKHIDVGAGVVDADYRGNVGVILFNFSDEDFAVSPGDRVAQMILEKIDMGATAVETEELPDTARGDGGFGSTGVSAAVGPGVKRPKVNGEVPDGTDKE